MALQEIDEMIKIVDKNGDGRISYSEFRFVIFSVALKKILKVSQTYSSFSIFHYGWVIDHPFDRNFYAWTLTHEPTLTENLQNKVFSQGDAWGVSPNYSQ